MITTFGEYIRLLRNEQKMTLTQLAAQLELDSANLSKIETGKRGFDEKKLPLFCEIFKLELDILLGVLKILKMFPELGRTFSLLSNKGR